MPDDLLTVAEAAKLLKVGPGTVYALCKAGKLEHYRIGLGRGTVRIERKAIDAMLLSGKRERTPEPGQVTLEDLYRSVGKEYPPKRESKAVRRLRGKKE